MRLNKKIQKILIKNYKSTSAIRHYLHKLNKQNRLLNKLIYFGPRAIRRDITFIQLNKNNFKFNIKLNDLIIGFNLEVVYDNAEIQKERIFLENKGKSGIYRWVNIKNNGETVI